MSATIALDIWRVIHANILHWFTIDAPWIGPQSLLRRETVDYLIQSNFGAYRLAGTDVLLGEDGHLDEAIRRAVAVVD